MSAIRMVCLVAFIIVSVAITVLVLMQEGKSQGLGSLSGQVIDVSIGKMDATSLSVNGLAVSTNSKAQKGQI